MNWKFFLAAIFLAISTMAAQAWDESGHLLIDAIAARRLHPEAFKKINALLPLLNTRFNHGQPYNFLTAGLWMDDMRALGKEYQWSRWHYVDIPCNGDRSYTLPPPPHALWALDRAVEVLRSKTAEPKERAEALAQVIHLVGDIHQPLHVADRNDRGGNAVPIAQLPSENGHGPGNLHAFWDAAYRYDVKDGVIAELWHHLPRPESSEEAGVLSTQAAALAALAPKVRIAPAGQYPWHPWHKWACETHMIACESGWPVERLEGRKYDDPPPLTPAFVHDAHKIALNRIALAGERLAALLNELLGDRESSSKQLPGTNP